MEGFGSVSVEAPTELLMAEGKLREKFRFRGVHRLGGKTRLHTDGNLLGGTQPTEVQEQACTKLSDEHLLVLTLHLKEPVRSNTTESMV